MDPNSPKKTIVEKYDLYFQDDAERYRRTYEAYEQFQAMTNQEAEGSSSGIKRARTYIPRDREEAEQRHSKTILATLTLLLNIRKRTLGEAVADQKLWIWHAYFRVPGSNNDLNVLYSSPLFDDVLVDTASEAPFVVNGRTYKQGYYLADGIYPTWSTFVKTFSIARDEKTLKFKRVQESARKDIERAFGVLQGRWGIIRQPARALQINTLKRESLSRICNELGSDTMRYTMSIASKELRDSLVHNELRHDLVNHLWNLDH
ncbi:ALP1-like protein isoform X1 [Tanacetum coccineum]